MSSSTVAEQAALKPRSFYCPHGRVYTPVGEVSLAKQAMSKECDINNIMKRYEKT